MLELLRMTKDSGVYIGADHGGFELKEIVKKHLHDAGVRIVDLGTFTNDSVDYPDVAREVAEKVAEYDVNFGILICGSGTGVCIAANKYKGIRAANAESLEIAKLAREHNNANVLCMGGRFIAPELALKMVDTFLNTPFSNEERHVRRVDKVNQIL